MLSGLSLILSVVLRQHFWVSYALMCLAIPGPFAAMAPFWAIPGETLPRAPWVSVMGLVNAFGNLGGFAGPYIVGWLVKEYQSTKGSRFLDARHGNVVVRQAGISAAEIRGANPAGPAKREST